MIRTGDFNTAVSEADRTSRQKSSRDKCVCVCSVVSSSLRPHGRQPARLLCPWDFSGKNTGLGCHFLIEGIFPTQGLNPCFLRHLHCRRFLTFWAIGWGSEQCFQPRWPNERSQSTPSSRSRAHTVSEGAQNIYRDRTRF